MLTSFVAVATGGALGSLLRWVIGLRFNAVFAAIPLGTLLSNLSAGYLIGLAVAFFARYPSLPGAWRLFIITGILGGLSTFSTFSSEVTLQIQHGRVDLAIAEVILHVLGSVIMTVLGIMTFALLQR